MLLFCLYASAATFFDWPHDSLKSFQLGVPTSKSDTIGDQKESAHERHKDIHADRIERENECIHDNGEPKFGYFDEDSIMILALKPLHEITFLETSTLPVLSSATRKEALPSPSKEEELNKIHEENANLNLELKSIKKDCATLETDKEQSKSRICQLENEIKTLKEEKNSKSTAIDSATQSDLPVSGKPLRVIAPKVSRKLRPVCGTLQEKVKLQTKRAVENDDEEESRKKVKVAHVRELRRRPPASVSILVRSHTIKSSNTRIIKRLVTFSGG